MTHIAFYIRYAFRNLRRNPRWSLFAMLAVAAGVMTVVALRNLGLSIGDSLTSNIQASNKGDITLTRASGPGGFNFGTTSERNFFSLSQMNTIRDFADRRGAQITEYSASNLQISAADQSGALFNFMTGYFIDPATYPLVGEFEAIRPAGASIGDLLQGERVVVISENLAETQRLDLGDQVRVTGSDVPYTVAGIAPTELEADIRSFFSAFFGFAYFNVAEAPNLNMSTAPNRVSLLLPEGTPPDAIREAGDQLSAMLRGSPGFTRVLTVPAILEQNATIADAIGRFVVIMGLGAMLIGGVGIINTMLVMVRRRTDEIAALKTFGLKGRQVAALFMTEALLLGVGGSIIGAIVGAGLSRITTAYGERFILQTIPWKLYPEAMVFGLVLGVVVTAVFGVIPVLTAVKVRPAIILRPNESALPALGIVQSLGVTAFVVIALGLIAAQIIGPFPAGVRTFSGLPLPQNVTAGLLLVAGTLTVLAVLTGVLWGIIWLVGKLPAFGSVEINLALRNMTTRRLRTATTLLAISTGIFAISSISFYGAGVQEVLRSAIGESLGGDVLIVSPASFLRSNQSIVDNSQRLLDETLDSLGSAVVYRTHFQSFDGRMMSVDDLSLREIEAGIDREAIFEEMNEAGRSGDFERASTLRRQFDQLETPVTIASYATDNPNLNNTVYRGRDLTPEDFGKPYAVILMDDRMIRWGVDVGSQITLESHEREFTFTVVGLVRENAGFQQDAFSAVTVPFGALGTTRPNFQFHTVQTDAGRSAEVQGALTALPFFFTIDVRLLDGIISRLIDQFSALPFLVGLLSLGAAGVIMANTVALATFERRRQIGVLKAIGLKRGRVVRVLLLENVIISILGATIGIGASGLLLVILTALGQDEIIFLPTDARPVAVALVLAALLIGAVATLFSARPAARERVMNVLRYD